MKQVQTLLTKVISLIQNSEYRSVKLHGVMCSRADLETIQMYCEALLRGESLSNYIMFENTKQVFEKAKIEYK